MLKVTVCIGSSCPIKGSRAVVEQLESLIAEKSLGEKIELCGAFCMGNCQAGVCVSIDGKIYSVTPDSVGDFFQNHVLPRV